MNLHHLELFHAVAACGSLSQAAAQTCTSQPSISKQLKTFEESLGLRLFDRLPRGMRLTQAGELLELHAREIFARRDRALGELQDLSNLRRGCLSMASSKTIGAYLLPDLLGKFLADHPGIETSVHVVNTRECAELVHHGQVEFALVEGPVDVEDAVVLPFRRDRLVVVASPDHVLSRRKGRIPLERVLSEPLVAREKGSGTREILDRELARQGLSWKPLLELESTEAIKGFVAAKAGLGVLSEIAVARDLKRGSLKRLSGALSLVRDLSVVRSRSRCESAAYRAFQKGLGPVR